MKHVDEIELIEYAAGNLTESQRVQVREHVVACRECSQRLEEMARLWGTLGDWNVKATGHNVTDRVLSLARQEQSGVGHDAGKAFLRMRLPLQILQVAASIIIAIGLGHKLGEYSVAGRKPQIASSQQKPEYLAALGLEWSSELAWLVLEDDVPDEGGEQ